MRLAALVPRGAAAVGRAVEFSSPEVLRLCDDFEMRGVDAGAVAA
jgi:hypothetical protein